MYLIIYSFIQCYYFYFKKAVKYFFFTISKAKHFPVETNNPEGNLQVLIITVTLERTINSVVAYRITH